MLKDTPKRVSALTEVSNKEKPLKNWINTQQQQSCLHSNFEALKIDKNKIVEGVKKDGDLPV